MSAFDAPLTTEAAAALGCQEKLFTSDGEVRPDLFFSTSVFHLSTAAVAVHLELDGIAKREIDAPDTEAGPVTIELAEGAIRLNQIGCSGIPTHAASSARIRDGSWQRAAYLPHFSQGGSAEFRRRFRTCPGIRGGLSPSFVVEELLDHPVLGSPNSHASAPAKAGGSVPSEPGREEAEKKAEVAHDVGRRT